MQLRFKLRTLLIATALVGLFLGLQVHAHNKAKRFVKSVGDPSTAAHSRVVRDMGNRDFAVSSASLVKLSILDVVLIRRRCEVNLLLGLNRWTKLPMPGESEPFTYYCYMYCIGDFTTGKTPD